MLTRFQSPANYSSVCTYESSYLCAVAAAASPDKYIILVPVDTAYADMALNLYEASFRPQGISNFLFMGIGNETCQRLNSAGIPCFHYANLNASDKPSVYASEIFMQKMNFKMDIVIDALAAQFTVLLLDVDHFFMVNPMNDLKVIVLYSVSHTKERRA